MYKNLFPSLKFLVFLFSLYAVSAKIHYKAFAMALCMMLGCFLGGTKGRGRGNGVRRTI